MKKETIVAHDLRQTIFCILAQDAFYLWSVIGGLKDLLPAGSSIVSAFALLITHWLSRLNAPSCIYEHCAVMLQNHFLLLGNILLEGRYHDILIPSHCWAFGLFPLFDPSAGVEASLFKDPSLNVIFIFSLR